MADHCCYEPSPLSLTHLSFLARMRSEEGPCVLQSRVKEVDDSDDKGRHVACVPTIQTPRVGIPPSRGRVTSRGGHSFLGSGWLRGLSQTSWGGGKRGSSLHAGPAVSPRWIKAPVLRGWGPGCSRVPPFLGRPVPGPEAALLAAAHLPCPGVEQGCPREAFGYGCTQGRWCRPHCVPCLPQGSSCRGPPSEEEGGPQGRSEMVTWTRFPENPWWLCDVISRKAPPVSPP